MNARSDRTLPPFEEIEGGWRIRSTERWDVLVLNMGFNWRIAIKAHADPDWVQWTRAWCYPKNEHDLASVVMRAMIFDADGSHEPIGWIKEAQTSRVACKSRYPRPNNQHTQYDPDCEHCTQENS